MRRKTRVCASFTVYAPEKAAQGVYETLYQHYRKLYFLFGEPGKSEFGEVLPALIQIAKTAKNIFAAMTMNPCIAQ